MNRARVAARRVIKVMPKDGSDARRRERIDRIGGGFSIVLKSANRHAIGRACRTAIIDAALGRGPIILERRCRRTILTIALSFGLAAAASPQVNRPMSGLAQSKNDQEDILVVGQPKKALSRWVRAESPNFIVYGVREDQIRQVTEKLRFHQLLGLLTHTPLKKSGNRLSARFRYEPDRAVSQGL